jgi:galactokinase
VKSVFAPGRVNLIGEHTDYAGGLVLPVAIHLGVTVRWRPATGHVRVRSLELGESTDLPAGAPIEVRAYEGWSREVAAVIRVLADAGRPAAGIDAELSSTVPIGRGLASSAAVTVALALALCRAASFSVDPLELARLARDAERLARNVPVGLMDPAASLLGRCRHALFLDCGKEEYRHVTLPRLLEIAVIDSGVRHDLEVAPYAARRSEVERGDPRRLRHVASENDRVRRVVTALESGDVEALGPLFRAGHDSLRDDFEASTPELDLLVDLAYESGAVGARLTGGGFGGSIVVLARQGDMPNLLGRVVTGYETETSKHAHTVVLRTADGAAASRERRRGVTRAQAVANDGDADLPRDRTEGWNAAGYRR